jgi:hypothetical protein
MLKFFFIKKHRPFILNYIDEVFEGSEESKQFHIFVNTKITKKPREITYTTVTGGDIRYALPLEDTPTDDTKKKNNTRYSDRDAYDDSAVTAMMDVSLQEGKPLKSIKGKKNLTFVTKLNQHILKKDLSSSAVYKGALLDRRLFSKMICCTDYQPSKDTAIALCFALHLTLEETTDLLDRAGYVLSHSLTRDIIIEYFIKAKEYNLRNINAVLYEMGEKMLGRQYF